MIDQARSVLPWNAKEPLAPRSDLLGTIGRIAEVVATWPGVIATTHWSLDYSEMEGVNFYLGDRELGHIFLDGSIHLATSPALGAAIVAEMLGKPSRWARGRTLASVTALGVAGAIDLFRRNYDRLAATAT